MDLRSDVRGAYTVWYRDVLRFFSDRTRIVASLGQPLLFLFIFGGGMAGAMASLGGGEVDYRRFMFPGIIGMSVLFTAVFSAVSVVWDREFGFLREVLVAPVSRAAVAIGKVAGGSTVAMFQGGIILLLAPFIGVDLTVGQVLSLLGLMLLLAAVMTAFGLLLAARQRTMEGFQMVMQFLLMPMLFVSGAFFPLNGVPVWLRWLADVNPVTYGVDALRQTVLSATVSESALAALSLRTVGANVACLAAFFLAFLVPAIALFSRQD